VWPWSRARCRCGSRISLRRSPYRIDRGHRPFQVQGLQQGSHGGSLFTPQLGQDSPGGLVQRRDQARRDPIGVARADDARRIRTVASGTFVTSIGLLFAFLGINAREVDPARSIFDVRSLPIYAAIATIALACGAVFASLT
jgi:hypothetical protein